MGLFSKNPLEKQIDIYNEHIEVKQEQFDELEGVDTAAAKVEREDLRDQLADLNIKIEQARDQLTEGESLNDLSD